MRILLVEDDAGLGEAVRDQITASGHTGDWAQTIADAKACSQTVSYDLILLDLMLPDGTGIVFFARVARGRRASAGNHPDGAGSDHRPD